MSGTRHPCYTVSKEIHYVRTTTLVQPHCLYRMQKVHQWLYGYVPFKRVQLWFYMFSMKGKEEVHV